MIKPLNIKSNQPADRFYKGGAKIRSFRGEAAEGNLVPEDWVASTTTLFGDPFVGLTSLEEGVLLVEEINKAPDEWLGPQHVASYGSDAMLLVKLLDAGQRLPVHIHPNQAFAGQHLGRSHGKAEAWFILDGGPIYLGFKRTVSRPELDGWVSGQNVDAMLEAMHRVEVAAGDGVYVPPGLPHAIGGGVFLVEVQEPEDLSILLEWKGFAVDGPSDGHLGLGFETALEATDRRGYSLEDIAELVVRQGSGSSTLSPRSQTYFRAELTRVTGSASFEAGFSILVVTQGKGTLQPANAPPRELLAGETVLVPYAAGDLEISGQLSVVRCQPPAPQKGGSKADRRAHQSRTR